MKEFEPEEILEEPQTPREVIFQPNEGPQTDFLAASEQEVLFGGAAGGGKSFAIVADPTRYFENPQFQGLLLRRTMPELRELISISQKLYPKIYPGAKWTERDTTWRFPSGAYLWLSYLEAEKDIDKYYGQAYSWIGFDELTHWESPIYWNMLASRLRTSKNSGLPLCMRATTNPGNRGHMWVKNMFINPSEPGKAFWARDADGEELVWPATSKHAIENDLVGKPMFKRRFIPSKLIDNPYLAEDGRYEANLLSLPEHKRKQLLEGDWDVAEGAAFSEFERAVHVIEPFNIPRNWLRFRACDYGYGSFAFVVWIAVDPYDEKLVVYRELKTKGVIAVDLADMILDIEANERVHYGVLDSSLWHNRGDVGPSLAEQMIRRGVSWRPSDRSKGSRTAGKNEVHRRLQFRNEETGEPGLQIFNTCTHLISELPAIPLDKKNPEDVDTTVDDHGYDALRYGLMSRPNSAYAWEDWDYHQPSSWEPADDVFGY